jgi:hypothetical protein
VCADPAGDRFGADLHMVSADIDALLAARALDFAIVAAHNRGACER